LFLKPWGEKDSLSALHHLDQALKLEERAITAWEILARKKPEAAEQLVLVEADAKLKGIDLKTLFKRRVSWQALAAPPLLLVWLLLLWLDFGGQFGKSAPMNQASSMAQKVKEFSRDLEERAKAQELKESFAAAEALEKLAEKNLRGEIGEKELGEALGGMRGQIEKKAPAAETDSRLGSTSREGLLDLKAELEAAKPWPLSGGAKRESEPGADFLDKLAALPRVREELERDGRNLEKLSAKELRDLLEKLERNIGQEMERRSLAEIQEFLALLLQGEGDRESEESFRAAPEAGPGRLAQKEKAGGQGTLPGDQPGKKEMGAESLPNFKARASTQIKGIPGEGKGSGLTLRGESKAGESKIPQEEALSNYRRQMEEELASERIPDGLKEAVKKYFLSLGMAEEKK
jgi:hypothetical protein